MDLFDSRMNSLLEKNAPLADRMRPRTLDEFFGQEHIIGHGRLLRRAIQIDQLSSLIFYGPPGTGKTTLARIIANTTKANFISINAVLAGIKEIRDAITSAQEALSLYGRRTILFIDEVHRFNKSQQDALLPHVENGIIILIGATTENPYFEVNKALVSRSRIFQLRTLTVDDLKKIALFAIGDKERGYGKKSVSIDEDALSHLVQVANGDARGVLNALELAVETTNPSDDGVIKITRNIAEDSIQRRAVLYDKDGDAHYDTISAFIKSVRGSDPDAALYWMSKMLYAGEDPRFIFRRMLILACEDVGLADPYALGVVMDAARAFDYVGLPEGRYHLAHACLYLAATPKSNSIMAFFDALKTVSDETKDDVPNHLRDSSRDADGFGHGAGYMYPHAYRDHWVAQQYLPQSLQGKVFYQPSDQGYEKAIRDRVLRQREAQIEAAIGENGDPFDAISAGSADVNLWLKRAGGGHGNRLAVVRDALIDLAEIRHDDLALDLHARTGLLSSEMNRNIKDGGVWAIAYGRDEYDTLVKTDSQTGGLSAPQIILSSPEAFDSDVRKNAGEKVRFTLIAGRNIIMSRPDKKLMVEKVVELLDKNGRIVLAETIACRGQRISALINLENESASFRKKFLSVEKIFFSNASDPMLNWDETSLKNLLEEIAGIKVKLIVSSNAPDTKVLPANIDFWLRASSQGSSRESLGDCLRRKFDEKEFDRIRTIMHASLDNRDVAWKTETAYIKITYKSA
jgi:putative ATPase